MGKAKSKNVDAQVTNVITENPVVEQQKPALSVAMLHSAITHANAQYKTRKGASANIDKSGYNPDLAKAYKIAANLNEAQLIAICELEIAEKLVAGLKDASNTKKPMRTLQAIMFTLTGSGSHLKGSAKTFLLEYCGLVVAGAKNRAGLRFCATGKGDDNTSDEVFSTAKARKLLNAFGAVSVASESTQNSVSFSKGGIAETLGLTKKDSRTGLPTVNPESKVTVALNAIIEKLTDSQISLIVAQASGK